MLLPGFPVLTSRVTSPGPALPFGDHFNELFDVARLSRNAYQHGTLDVIVGWWWSSGSLHCSSKLLHNFHSCFKHWASHWKHLSFDVGGMDFIFPSFPPHPTCPWPMPLMLSGSINQLCSTACMCCLWLSGPMRVTKVWLVQDMGHWDGHWWSLNHWICSG